MFSEFKFGDWIKSPKKEGVPWRKEDRFAIFIAKQTDKFAKAIMLNNNYTTTIFSYDDWKKHKRVKRQKE